MGGATVGDEEVKLEPDVGGWDDGGVLKWLSVDRKRLSSSSRLVKLSAGRRLLSRSAMPPGCTGPGKTAMVRWSTPSEAASSPIEVRHTSESG